MSQQVRGLEKSLVAAADLSAKLFYIAKVDTSGNLALAAAATDPIVGVIQNNDGGSGAMATYRFLGTSKVIAGGSISIGDLVTSDSAGKAVATTTNKDIVIGRALEAADSGDIIEVQLSIHKASF